MVGRKLIDITGQRFGRLTVLYRDALNSTWVCKCDCGNVIIQKTSQHLRSGRVVSCNCFWNDYIDSVQKHNKPVVGIRRNPKFRSNYGS